MPNTANYGFYSPPLTGVTPNVPRDTLTLANAVDVALKAEEDARIAGDAMYSGSANATTTQASTTAVVDLAGCSLTVPNVLPADVYLVLGTFDVSVSSTAGGAFVGRLMVDGTNRDEQALLSTNELSFRTAITQTWLVTGLTAGSRVFKLNIIGSTTAGKYTSNTPHSGLRVVQIF